MDDAVYKGPQEIDLERELLEREGRQARVGLIVRTITLVLVLGLNFMLMHALLARFPVRETVYTANAAAVCSFAPVNEAGDVSPATVREFAARAAEDVHRLDYANWRSTLDAATIDRFTPEARTLSVEGLRSSGILRSVVRNNLVIKPIINDLVVITDYGVVDGVYQWRVRVPLLLAYIGGSAQGTTSYRPEARTLEMTIIRTPMTVDTPDGLLVASIYSTQTIAASEIGG